MDDPLPAARLYFAMRFLGGVALLTASALGWVGDGFAWAMGSTSRLSSFDFIAGTCGFWIAAKNIGQFARLSSESARRHRADFERLRQEFARTTLPRQLFFLLYSIAEVDGRAVAAERETVRRFLLERFTDPVSYHELRFWEAQRLPRSDVGPMATRLAEELSESERSTVFFWSCLVAVADGRFSPHEHQVLQDVSRAFGLQADHARALFHQARQWRLSHGAAAGGHESGRYAPPAGMSRAQHRAYRILGLEPGAPSDQVRARHRELVKQHHPDAHSHLGPVAAREATRRFREIQAAYELLVS